MRKIKQAQNGGDSSINLQAGKIVINQGPTPAEIKAIALGVFNENILKFSAEGSKIKIASRRAEKITDAFVEKLRIALAVSLEGIKEKAQFNKDMLADSEVIQNIVHLSGNFVRKLCEVWSRSQMKNMTLTSVGIAIAHANLRRKTAISIDLNIWIK